MELVKVFQITSEKTGRACKIVAQGLKNHPEVEIIQDANKADLLIASQFAAKESQNYDIRKLAIVDYGDSPHSVVANRYSWYFKRSWPESRLVGNHYIKNLIKRPKNWFPIAYCIMDEFILDGEYEKKIDILCSLRNQKWKNRGWVRKFINDTDFGEDIVKIAGPVTDGGLTCFCQGYLESIASSRLVISANPDHWEGDHRTWETLPSGSLLFVDRLITPFEYPLKDGEHCVFYDLTSDGKRELKEKIKYYLEHPEEAKKIGENGKEYGLKYHRTSNLIDYILRKTVK